MSLDEYNIERNVDISELLINTMQFIRERLKNIDPYQQSQELYILHDSPIIVESVVRRTKDIIYINTTYKKILVKSIQTNNLDVSNEMAIVITHFNTKFLEDKEKVDVFLDKIYLKIDEWINLLLSKIDIDMFDIVRCDFMQICDMKNTSDKKSTFKITRLATYKNISINETLIDELLHNVFEDVQEGSNFEQFRIHFSNLSLTNGSLCTDFTILITAVQYDKVKLSTYLLFDIVNDDEDRKRDGMDGFKGAYGIPLLAFNPNRQLRCNFYLTENTIELVETFIKSYSKNMVEVIKLLSDSCFVGEIVVERKEI